MKKKDEVLKELGASYDIEKVQPFELQLIRDAIDLAIKIKTKECKEQKRKQIIELKKVVSHSDGMFDEAFPDERVKIIDKIFKEE